MTNPYKINYPLSGYAIRLLKMYLKFPENAPFTAVDWRAEDGYLLDTLTSGHEQRFLYGVAEKNYNVSEMRDDRGFHKVSQASFMSDMKVTNEVFSLMVINTKVDERLVSELFDTVDPFTMPNFEEEVRTKVMRDEAERQRLQQETGDQIDFGAMDMDNQEVVVQAEQESPEKREARIAKKFKQEMDNRVRAWRLAMRDHAIRLRSLRQDSILLQRTHDYLRPGGVLVMITPKELIDDTIAFKLVNQFEDIKILRLDDREYQDHRKCIILARKRRKASRTEYELGKTVALTKEKPYRTFGELTEITVTPEEDLELYEAQVNQRKIDAMYDALEPQTEPLFVVPNGDPEDINSFRVGAVTANEALASIQKSKTIETYRNKYAQTFINREPITPTPLHKGHIMLLLTSGLLNGYIGTGPDQHLVKGSAVKDFREFSEEEEDGTTKVVEREFYNIGVKLLDANGVFRKIM